MQSERSFERWSVDDSCFEHVAVHYLILIHCDRVLPLLYGQLFTAPDVIHKMKN